MLKERGLQSTATLGRCVRVDHAGGEAKFITHKSQRFAQVRVVGYEDCGITVPTASVEHHVGGQGDVGALFFRLDDLDGLRPRSGRVSEERG